MNDIEEYENAYLRRFGRDQKSLERKKARVEAKKARQEKEELERKKDQATLSTWDYVLLECIRKEDMRMSLKIGPMQSVDSTEKLFYCGLIRKADRVLSLDERMRIHGFFDSAEYRQHEKRLQSVINKEEKERIKAVFTNLGITDKDDMWELTDAGQQKIREKRDEMRLLWKRLGAFRAKDGVAFQKEVAANLPNLPLFLTMGIAHGAILGYMMSESTTDHTHGITEVADISWSESAAGWNSEDFDVSGIGF